MTPTSQRLGAVDSSPIPRSNAHHPTFLSRRLRGIEPIDISGMFAWGWEAVASEPRCRYPDRHFSLNLRGLQIYPQAFNPLKLRARSMPL